MENNVLFARILMLVLCACITIGCFWKLNQSYDPLARYPFGTEQQRKVILDKLDNKEIDYLISQHIRPKTFMKFIPVDGFDVYHCQEYSIAKKVQEESNDYIVNFVNKYTKYFSRDDLSELLKHYSYAELTSFYENDLGNNEDLSLMDDPSQKYLILNGSQSVYRYEPGYLVDTNGVTVCQEMQSDLENMINTYATMMDGRTLQVSNGYMSYDAINEMVTQLIQTYGQDSVSHFYLPAGQNEWQLGYTVSFFDTATWIRTCLDYEKEHGQLDYPSIIQSLPQESQDLIVWLEENAYHYGFVIRYPSDKRDQTKMEYQPFVLRYVGKSCAKKMQTSNQCMEEMDFSDYEE